ncbi:hypothetical protein K492DRAFT_179096 [Lichtheimia hyalospora FSU 10163]|nr:hypothetical protein K492DRAFT_179096 [Lichtheimia hyalospora FSU 10163]
MDKNIDAFVSDNNVRLTWIAFFTQWVLWGAVYLLRHVVSEGESSKTSEDPETAAKKEGKFWKGSTDSRLENRVANLNNVLRENTLLLLSVLILNTFGNASTRAVMIITWIYFAFTVVFAFSELLYGNRVVRLGYSAIFYGLTLAIGGTFGSWRKLLHANNNFSWVVWVYLGLSFAQGW